MRILILASNPRNDLKLDREIRDLREVIEKSRFREQFEVEDALAVRVKDLQNLLLKHEPQIVHFCGHGSGQQGLVFEGNDGAEQWVRAEALSDLFRLFSENVECVLLNACYSEEQANAIVNHINYVIGMNQEIRDDAAIAFSKGFYLALGYDRSIEQAFKFGCNAIQLEISGSSKMRSGATDEMRKIEVVDAIQRTPIPEHLKPILKMKPNLTPSEKANITASEQSLTTAIQLDIDKSLGAGTAIGNVEGREIHIGDRIYQADLEVKRIVREELRSTDKKYGDSVSQGLIALADLMQAPAVRDSVITFRVVFKAACDQIDVIADYKLLHDLLHTLEFQCYNAILDESKRFPEDETGLGILMEHELILQDLRGQIQQVAARETIATQDVQWLPDLQKAQLELHNAVETLETRHLQRTIWLLNRVLAIQPSRINTNLTGAARSLRLPDLVHAMTFISEELASANLDQEKRNQFQQGVTVLADLNQRLTALVIAHDYFQEFDLVLRRIGDTLVQNSIELEMSWPDLQERTEGLFDAEAGPWAKDFQQDGQNLDAALKAQNPAKIKLYFRLYRRRASVRFFQVDVTLKRLCEELRKVDEPLASVLRMIA